MEIGRTTVSARASNSLAVAGYNHDRGGLMINGDDGRTARRLLLLLLLLLVVAGAGDDDVEDEEFEDEVNLFEPLPSFFSSTWAWHTTLSSIPW